jgi:hypothetical protein
MAVTTDILQTWRDPRSAIRHQLDRGRREDRALAIAMGASALSFVAQWPRLAREAHLQPEVPLDARMGASLFATMFVLPLVLYGIAALTHLALKALAGQSDAFGARLALFWAMLAISPAVLFQGLVSGMIGPGAAGTVVGVAVAGFFAYLWIQMLREVARP